MTHDELLARVNTESVTLRQISGMQSALTALIKLCSTNGYTTWDKSMVSKVDGVYDMTEAKQWESVHGHDIRVKCYPEHGCLLWIDPEDILQVIEGEWI